MPNLEQAFQQLPRVSVIGGGLKISDYIPIDLSVTNAELQDADIGEYILNHISKNRGRAAIGGYNEQRNLYRDSELFVDEIAQNERDIHLGIDIWIEAGTPVLAALDGIIHSFNYNPGKGNYGPTIILEHEILGDRCYTLYGHLSAESLDDIELGDKIKAQSQIGTLGSEMENGGYLPHLHFQIIKDLQDNFGDFPGVCSKQDQSFYLENCPDPNLLLKL